MIDRKAIMIPPVADQCIGNIPFHVILRDLIKCGLAEGYTRRLKFRQEKRLCILLEKDQVKAFFQAMEFKGPLNGNQAGIEFYRFDEICDPQLSDDFFRRCDEVFFADRIEDQALAFIILREPEQMLQGEEIDL